MSWQSHILIELIRFLHPLPGTHRSPQRQREALDRIALLARRPRDVRVVKIRAAGLKAVWLVPREARPGKAVLYLHGGAYQIGSIRTHREIASYVARYAQATVLLVEYRLAPEHPFPAALEDALAAYRWLLEQGYPPQGTALAGDSAGGGLAIATLLSLRNSHQAMPAAAALISPWVDLLGTGESIQTRNGRDPLFSPRDLPAAARHYLNGHDPCDPLISPVYALLDGLPPVLIQVGDEEILLSDSTRLADGLRRGQVPVEISIWPGLWHVYQAAGMRMPESKQAFIQMGAFIRSHTSG